MPPKRSSNFTMLAGSTIQGGSVSSWSASQNNVARQVLMELMAGGLSKAGAAGVIGNLMQESGLNPSIVQSNGEGHYLAQWGGSRLVALQSYAASIGLPVTNVQAQARFIVHELKTSYGSLFSTLSTTSNPAAAALAVSNQYERPAAASANNAARQAWAIQAYQSLSPASGYAADGTGQGGAGGSTGSAPGSLLDLITSPIDTLGGWLASLAVTLLKDTAQGIGDVIIIPAWHWQQRTAAAYSTELFSNLSWPLLPWTAAFWGLGYFLLFTDPNGNGSLRPASVTQSRVTRHARRLQSIPARRSLIRPKDVQGRTPRKPTPVVSTAPIKRVGSFSTSRPHTVTVTGDTIASHRRNTNDSSGGVAGGPGPAPASSGRPRKAAIPASAGAPRAHSVNRPRNHSLSGGARHSQGGAVKSPRKRT